MKLTKVHVTEFQSIRDSNEFEVGEITCLVGKNEAGKTALLQSLYRLHPLVEKDGVYDVTDDYLRSDVEDYRHKVETQKRSPATVVAVTFELEESEIKAISADLGRECLKSTQMILQKGYEHKASGYTFSTSKRCDRRQKNRPTCYSLRHVPGTC